MRPPTGGRNRRDGAADVYVSQVSGTTTTIGSTVLIFGVAFALSPLMQATHLDGVSSGAGLGPILVVVFIVLAAIELLLMRLLRVRRPRTSWIVRACAFAAFIALIVFTPQAKPMRLF